MCLCEKHSPCVFLTQHWVGNSSDTNPQVLSNSDRVRKRRWSSRSPLGSVHTVPVDQHRSGNWACPEMYTWLPLQQPPSPKSPVFSYFFSTTLGTLANSFQSKPRENQQITHKRQTGTWVSPSGFGFSRIHTAVYKVLCKFSAIRNFGSGWKSFVFIFYFRLQCSVGSLKDEHLTSLTT